MPSPRIVVCGVIVQDVGSITATGRYALRNCEMPSSKYSVQAANHALTVSLDSLSAQQLTQVKKQLDEEVEHLTTSFAQLQAAQIKFKDCLRCVKLQGTTPGE